MVQLSAIAPYRLMRPYVGRSPTVPQAWLGEMIDPSVSVPSAKPTRPAAVDAAEPALDPLDVCSVFHGVFVMPLNHRPPCASAPIESLAIRDRKSTRLNSSHLGISYAVFCLKKKNINNNKQYHPPAATNTPTTGQRYRVS